MVITHQSSLICFLHLLWSMALHARQSFSTISKFSLVYFLATSYSLHFFTQSLSSFCRTCPYHCNLFCCSTKIMSVLVSLSTLYLELSCTLMPHIHLTILILPTEVPRHFPFLWARSHFYATYYFTHNCCTNFVQKLQKDLRKRKRKPLFLDYSGASNHEAGNNTAIVAMCRLVRNLPACTLHVMCTFEMCGPEHAFLRKLVNLLLVTWISRRCWMVLKTSGMKVHKMCGWFVCKILQH